MNGSARHHLPSFQRKLESIFARENSKVTMDSSFRWNDGA